MDLDFGLPGGSIFLNHTAFTCPAVLRISISGSFPRAFPSRACDRT
jgi:hypothetical protein